jgi:crotonobetainyl-CoA:carnitine CoA-transferase CaiB-like acyl-CoA transferase
MAGSSTSRGSRRARGTEAPATKPPSRPTVHAFTLLKGVRILDLTSSLAGPYATWLLADMGADVVKVERPGVGDDARAWGPPFLQGNSLWFLSVNRNKKSVALNYAVPEGRLILNRLVAAADAVIISMRRPTLVKLGLQYQRLKRIRPSLVYCTITGFGMTGPYSDAPCYDLIAEGHSGIMDLTGEPDSPPQKVGTPAADLLAGMDAAFGTVSALLDQARTGRGHQLDVSLSESMTRFLTPHIVSYMGSGELPRRSGGRESVIAVYQVFETADEPITVGLGNDRIFVRFCEAIGQVNLAHDSRYFTNDGRRRDRAQLVRTIQDVLRRRRRAEWLETFGRAGIPAGPINRLDDVVADPHFVTRKLFYEIAGDFSIPQVNTGWLLDSKPNEPRLAPPRLGSDTEQVLRSWAGMSRPELRSARGAGVLS